MIPEKRYNNSRKVGCAPLHTPRDLCLLLLSQALEAMITSLQSLAYGQSHSYDSSHLSLFDHSSLNSLYTQKANRTQSRYCVNSTMTASSSCSIPWRGIGDPRESCWLHRLVELSFPSSDVIDVQISKGHLHLIYLLKLSNGTELTLKMHGRPRASLRRHESTSIETEAKVLSHLCASNFRFAPGLVRYGRQLDACSTGSYIFKEYVPGIALSDFEETSLTNHDRQDIERQYGNAVRLIGEHIGSSFGTVEAVSTGRGKKSWRHAFMVLLDSLLFEAENKLISLPRTEIRQQAVRLMGSLDSVMKARLVVLDLGRPSHIIVDTSTKRIAGFTNFANAFWADLLFSEAFENPSPAFIQGYGFNPIQDESARARLLL